MNHQLETGSQSNNPDQQGSSQGRGRPPGRHAARPLVMDYGQPDDVEEVDEGHLFHVDMAFVHGIIIEQVGHNPLAQTAGTVPPATIGQDMFVQTPLPEPVVEHVRSDVDVTAGPEVSVSVTPHSFHEQDTNAGVNHAIGHHTGISSPIQLLTTASLPYNNNTTDRPAVVTVSVSPVDEFLRQSISETEAAETLSVNTREHAQSMEDGGRTQASSNTGVCTSDPTDTCRGLPAFTNDDTTAESLETISLSGLLDEIRPPTHANTDHPDGVQPFSIAFPGATQPASRQGDNPDSTRSRQEADVTEKPATNSKTDASADSSYDDILDEQEMLASAENDFVILPAREAASPVMVPAERTQQDADSLLEQVIKGKSDQTLGPNIASHDPRLCSDSADKGNDIGIKGSLVCDTDRAGDDGGVDDDHGTLASSRAEAVSADEWKGDTGDSVNGIYCDVSENSCRGDNSCPDWPMLVATSSTASQANKGGHILEKSLDHERNTQSNGRDSHLDTHGTHARTDQCHWGDILATVRHVRHQRIPIEQDTVMDSVVNSTPQTGEHTNKQTENEASVIPGKAHSSEDLPYSDVVCLSSPRTRGSLPARSCPHASEVPSGTGCTGEGCAALSQCELLVTADTTSRCGTDNQMVARDVTDVTSSDAAFEINTEITRGTNTYAASNMVEPRNQTDARIDTNRNMSWSPTRCSTSPQNIISPRKNASAKTNEITSQREKIYTSGNRIPSPTENWSIYNKSIISSRENESTYSKDMISPRQNGSIYSKEMISPRENGSTYSKDMISPRQNGSIYSKEMISPRENESTYSKDMISPRQNGSIYGKEMISPRENGSTSSKDMISLRENSSTYSKGMISPRENGSTSSKDMISLRENSSTYSKGMISPRENGSTSSKDMISLRENSSTYSKGMISPRENGNTYNKGMIYPRADGSPYSNGMISPRENESTYNKGMISTEENGSISCKDMNSPRENGSTSSKRILSTRKEIIDRKDTISPLERGMTSTALLPTAENPASNNTVSFPLPQSECGDIVDSAAPSVPCTLNPADPPANVGSCTHILAGNTKVRGVIERALSPRQTHSCAGRMLLLKAPINHDTVVASGLRSQQASSASDTSQGVLSSISSDNSGGRTIPLSADLQASPGTTQQLHIASTCPSLAEILGKEEHFTTNAAQSCNHMVPSPRLEFLDTQNCHRSLPSMNVESTAGTLLAPARRDESTDSSVSLLPKFQDNVQRLPASTSARDQSDLGSWLVSQDANSGQRQVSVTPRGSQANVSMSLSEPDILDPLTCSGVPGPASTRIISAALPADTEDLHGSATDRTRSPVTAGSASQQSSSHVAESPDKVFRDKILQAEMDDSTPTQGSGDAGTCSSHTSHISCDCYSDVGAMMSADVQDIVEMVPGDYPDSFEMMPGDAPHSGVMMSGNVPDNAETMSADVADNVEMMSGHFPDNVEAFSCFTVRMSGVTSCGSKTYTEAGTSDKAYDGQEMCCHKHCRDELPSAGEWCRYNNTNGVEGLRAERNKHITCCKATSHTGHQVVDNNHSRSDLHTDLSPEQCQGCNVSLRDWLAYLIIQNLETQNVTSDQSEVRDDGQHTGQQGRIGGEETTACPAIDTALSDRCEGVRFSDQGSHRSQRVVRDVFSPWETDDDCRSSDIGSQIGDDEDEGGDETQTHIRASPSGRVFMRSQSAEEVGIKDDVVMTAPGENWVMHSLDGQDQFERHPNTSLQSIPKCQEQRYAEINLQVEGPAPAQEANTDNIGLVNVIEESDPFYGRPSGVGDTTGTDLHLEPTRPMVEDLIPVGEGAHAVVSERSPATNGGAWCPSLGRSVDACVLPDNRIRATSAVVTGSPREFERGVNKEDMASTEENLAERIRESSEEQELVTRDNAARAETSSWWPDKAADCVHQMAHDYFSLTQLQLNGCQVGESDPNLLVHETNPCSPERLATPVHLVRSSAAENSLDTIDKMASLYGFISGEVEEFGARKGTGNLRMTGNDIAETRSGSIITGSSSVDLNTELASSGGWQLPPSMPGVTSKCETLDLEQYVIMPTVGPSQVYTERLTRHDQCPTAQVILEATDKWLSRITDICKSPDFLTSTSNSQQLHALAAHCKSEILAISRSPHFTDKGDVASRASTPGSRRCRGHISGAGGHKEDCPEIFEMMGLPEDTAASEHLLPSKNVFTPRPPSSGCRNPFTSLRLRSAKFKTLGSGPATASAGVQAESLGSPPCQALMPSTPAAMCVESGTSLPQDRACVSSSNLISNDIYEKTGDIHDSIDNLPSPRVDREAKDVVGGVTLNNDTGTKQVEDEDTRGNSYHKSELPESGPGNSSSGKLFKRRFAGCQRRQKSEQEPDVTGSSWSRDKSQDGADSRPRSDCRTPYTSAVQTPATTSFECISDETDSGDRTTTPAMSTPQVYSRAHTHTGRHGNPRSRPTLQPKHSGPHHTAIARKQDIPRSKQPQITATATKSAATTTKSAAIATKSAATTTKTTHGKCMKMTTPTVLTSTRDMCPNGKPPPAITSTRGQCPTLAPPTTTPAEKETVGQDLPAKHINRVKIEPLKVKAAGKSKPCKGITMQEFERIQQNRHLSEAFARINSSKACVDCHMDSRYLDKHGPSLRRRRERVNYNCLIALENIKFLEMLRYKKSVYRRDGQLQDFKKNYRKMLEMGKHADQWPDMGLLDYSLYDKAGSDIARF
ncbi:unnamed protein product [Candidula unifasciata]|uniref:Uncharacterized protein n=1 Tax=Candidula unifasciata TaxID=100452 RepID=A0A8S3Z828_9EUPU|nr:unnamed protein product [Candidula unifasciata]